MWTMMDVVLITSILFNLQVLHFILQRKSNRSYHRPYCKEIYKTFPHRFQLSFLQA